MIEEILTPSRRRYLAKIFANLSLLAFGAIGTSEIFKLSLAIKLVLVAMGTVLIVLGTLIEPGNKEGGR